MKRITKPCSLPFQDILYMEGMRNYTQIVFRNGEKVTLSHTLKHFELLLADHQVYIRTHKSFLVNLQTVKTIVWHADEPYMTLSNDDRVAIARRKRRKVRKRLKCLPLS